MLRAQVQVQNQRQRRSSADNDFEKAKLKLARAIGLPPGQAVTLTDTIPYAPLEACRSKRRWPMPTRSAPTTWPRAGSAGGRRGDARPRPRRTAAVAPFDADYGTIGQASPDAHPTYTMWRHVRVPIFEGRPHRRRSTHRGDALVSQRRAEYDDLRGRIDMEVRTALLDVGAARSNSRPRTPRHAGQPGTGAGPRPFRGRRRRQPRSDTGARDGGRASDNYIDALYAHNLAKASLARAVGIAEQAVTDLSRRIQ